MALVLTGMPLSSGWAAPVGNEVWTLSFADEFDGPTLNTSIWNTTYRGVEARYDFQDGVLRLRMDNDGGQYTQDGTNFGVASIDTKNKFAQQYGRFEIRAKLPGDDGILSAFWMMPNDSAYHRTVQDGGIRQSSNEPIEIDIFEHIGRNESLNFHTIHYGRRINAQTTQSDSHWQIMEGGGAYSDGFLVYALEWTPNGLRFETGVDADHMQAVWTTDKTPHDPFYILLSLYEGTSWAGQPAQGQAYPRYFEIDYLRVYELVPEPATGGLILLGMLVPLRHRRWTRSNQTDAM